jgi:large subunit ribosomal protein L10
VNRAEKTKAIEELGQAFETAKGVFISDYTGMTVAEITDLRVELKKSETDFKVVKNRLALRAIDGLKDSASFEPVKEHFDYTTSVAFTYGDVSGSAKTLAKHMKANEKFKFKAACLEGKVISLAEMKALATLPSREELLAKLLGTFQAVPGGFVRVLAGVPEKWVRVLQAVKDKKAEEGDS